MNKFKVGDKVKIRNDKNDGDNQSRLLDLGSDIRIDLADRTISGTDYDKIWKAIEKGKTFVVTKVEDDYHPMYEVKIEGIGYMIHEDDLDLEIK